MKTKPTPKFRLKTWRARQMICQFLFCDDGYSDTQDESGFVERIQAASYPITFLMDRFSIDINDISDEEIQKHGKQGRGVTLGKLEGQLKTFDVYGVLIIGRAVDIPA